MERAIMSLHVEKGPSKGEVVDCRKRTKVTVGRVTRWNTFVIRESAISQRHLLMELKNGKWTVVDLDTSNGTIFNDAKLPPNKPRPLKNGDLIKIGAETIIRVQIQHPPKPQPPAKSSLERKSVKPQGRERSEEVSSAKEKRLLENVVASGSKKVAECSDRKGVKPQGWGRRGGITGRKEKLPLENVAPQLVAAAASAEKAAECLGNRNSGNAPESITLAEWFDLMEQWLPKHLNEISENVIREMKAQSEQFDAYILPKDWKGIK